MHMNRLFSPHLILICILAFAQPTRCEASASKPYFQQEVRYRIDVQLDDSLHALHGNWTMTYVNNSNDALSEIRMHIWPNAYSSNQTALARQLLKDGDTQLYYLKKEMSAGKIDSLAFSTEGRTLRSITHPQHPDICTIMLTAPLGPGDSVTISSPFRVTIPPGSISRLGHIGQAYAITQWYPKPAVYDQDGWHEMPYLNQGEFYSEYGSFDVRITIPANYVVGATGDLQNPEEQTWLEQKAQEPLRAENDMGFPESDKRLKTLRFTQQNVHDFAWFADKRYQVRKGEVALPYSGRKVTTWALFTQKEAKLWERAIEYINDAVFNYSKWIGEYPYSQCTAVDGTISAGGGMEYPNVTIIGSSGSAFPLEVVIAHEVGHNWFYGLLGSNEREHPWMDEGINSYYEMRYVLEKYPPHTFGNLNELSSSPNTAAAMLGLNRLDYRQTSRFSYLLSGAAFTEQAIGLPADQFTGMNYGTVVYKKTAVAMDYLAHVLGQDVFDSCMHQYFRSWVYRHPGPNDIRTVFESVSERNLGWFFDGLIHAEEGSDACIHHVHFDKDQVRFEVTEKGPVPLPVEVTAYRGDSALARMWIEPWKTGFSIPCTGCDRIELDANRRSLDINPNNNSSRWTTPHLSLIPGIRDPKRNTVAITPIMGWNATDRWMPGLNITNMGIPNQPIEFSLMPLYSIASGRVNGTAGLEGVRPVKGRYTDRIRWQIQYRSFSFAEEAYRSADGQIQTAILSYSRLNPQLILEFRKADPTGSRHSELKISSVHLWQDEIKRDFTSSNQYAGKPASRYSDFYRMAYRFDDKRAIDPWWTELRAETNRQLLKTEGEFNYSYSYHKKKRSFDLRLYGGYAFIDKTAGEYGFFLSDRNASRGSVDYAFDDWYFGRSATSGTLFSQMALRQGQFRQYTPFGQFKPWIVTINLSSSLPGPFGFLRAFADLGTTADLQSDLRKAYDLEQSLSYTAGLQITLVNKAVAVYFPLIFSEEMKRYEDFQYDNRPEISSFDRFTRRIRFTFDLNRMRLSSIRNSAL